MKNEEFKVLLYRAVAKLPSSSGIVMWVLSNGKLQRILKKYGAGKPTIIIFGEPGNGKTSLTSAMLGNSIKIKFVYGLKEIKKAITDSKRERKILLIDNYSAALSHSKQEANRRCLDHIIDRVSEDEESSPVIITGEPIIVEDVKKVASM